MGAHDAQERGAAERLRELLRTERARQGLDVTALARRSGLGRTTVSQALNDVDNVPSAQTVAALAKVLKLDATPLLALRREASTPKALQREAGPGVPIGQCDPLDLEVHPAGDRLGRDDTEWLPGYVRRAHDDELNRVVEQAAAGYSAMAMLVGTSSTGKTRACWEAVQPLAEDGWLLWHPFDPTRANAALSELGRVSPRTVVWLNEAQHYLDAGEAMAAALQSLLSDPGRAPVLVLGTLWPTYDNVYAALPRPGFPDPHARTRELLAGRRIMVPEAFDPAALKEAARLAEGGDRSLAGVLTRGHGGRVAQHLAGAPELLRRYAGATPAARALLHAAMDARRLGAGLHLPLAFLVGAAPDYLDRDEFDALGEDWLERALAELAEPVHGGLAPMRRVRERPNYGPPGTRAPAAASVAGGPLYRLADYLEQHGRRERRTECPPVSFWHAAHAHLTNLDDVVRLGDAALERYRLQWADALYRRALDARNTDALTGLARVRDLVGDMEEAEALYRRAADAGAPFALADLAQMLELAGDRAEAERVAHRAAEVGDSSVLSILASVRERTGDVKGAEALYLRAVDARDPFALTGLTQMLELAGDRAKAEELYRRAIEDGDTDALTSLAWLREKAGDRVEAEALYQRAIEDGNTHALTSLAQMREEAGHRVEAEELYWRAIDAGDNFALATLAVERERAGDQVEAEKLYRRAVESGDGMALTILAVAREQAGERAEAERIALHADEAGSRSAVVFLALVREDAGDFEGVEAIYRRAADAGNDSMLINVAKMRERAGNQAEAEALYRRALDAGIADAMADLARMAEQSDTSGETTIHQFGLDPDGTPSHPW